MRFSTCFSLIILIVVFVACDKQRPFEVEVRHVDVKSHRDILQVTDSLVIPALYKNTASLDSVPPDSVKQYFFSMLLPAVLIVKEEICNDKAEWARLLTLDSWTAVDSADYKDLCDRYGIRARGEGVERIDALPNSIVLAQAAIESGWGQSRFFREGNNVFGVWSFSESEKRMEAQAVRGTTKIFVRAYEDLRGSVRDYFKVLSSSNAFRGLRITRVQTQDPRVLVPYLKNYSERGSAYTKLVNRVIEQNNLRRFDSYSIDPNYIDEQD